MPAAFLILSFLQPVGLHWLCAIVLGAPFTLLTSPFFLYPHPTFLSLSLYNPSRSRSIWFFSMGKIKKKPPFSNDDFFCCCLTSKPRTPTHAPPRAVVWGVFTHRQLRSHPLSSWTFWTFTPSWTLLTFFLLLLPPFCVHPTVWTITLHSIPKTSLRLCNASWYDWIFLFVCLLLTIGDSSRSYKSKKNKKKHMKGRKKYFKKCRQTKKG